MRKCKYLIRRHKFHELAKESPMRALTFLQTDLAATVDHNDIEETTEVWHKYILSVCVKCGVI